MASRTTAVKPQADAVANPAARARFRDVTYRKKMLRILTACVLLQLQAICRGYRSLQYLCTCCRLQCKSGGTCMHRNSGPFRFACQVGRRSSRRLVAAPRIKKGGARSLYSLNTDAIPRLHHPCFVKVSGSGVISVSRSKKMSAFTGEVGKAAPP